MVILLTFLPVFVISILLLLGARLCFSKTIIVFMVVSLVVLMVMVWCGVRGGGRVIS